MTDKYVVFVLGAPGSGKGTQCEKIVDKFGWGHVSVGDLLREEVKSGSELGNEIDGVMKEGKMVPAELSLELLTKALKKSANKRFLVDGFPRKLEQLEAYEQKLKPTDHMLVFTVSDDAATERLLKRGETSGRSDDNEETIRKRLRVFQEETVPVIERVREEGKLTEIDGEAEPDEVFARVEEAIQKLQQQSGDGTAAEDGQAKPSGPNRIVVISGPSGVGKGTLISKLTTEYPDAFGFSVSHTTRGPRNGEVDGQHYHFTDHDSMQADVDAGGFLEHASVHGNMYGTSQSAVEAVTADGGRVCILDIDVQGAQQVRKSALASSALFLFVSPPSEEELESRLRGRGTESEDKVLQRLANAKAEMDKGQEPGLFDAVIVNADLDDAYEQLKQHIAEFAPDVLEHQAKPTAAAGVAAGAAGKGGSSTKPVAASGSAAVKAKQQKKPAAADGGREAAGTVRDYLDGTVVPVLREGLKALNESRPADPLQFLADYLVSKKQQYSAA